MSSKISRFETISRHQAKLNQPKPVISCLVSVLNYIKEVLTDDMTQTIYQMIEQHVGIVGKNGITAHYMNVEKLGDQIIAALRKSFIFAGEYVDPNSEVQQINTFLANLPPEGNEQAQVYTLPNQFDVDIPTGDADFIKWLITKVGIYTTELPTDYDAFGTALSLNLVEEWFGANHDNVTDVHRNTLQKRLNQLLTICGVLPIRRFMANNFLQSPFALIGPSDYASLMMLVATYLTAIDNPVTIDFTSYQDTNELLPPSNNVTTIAEGDYFFNSIYPFDAIVGVNLLQLNAQAIDIMAADGDIPLVGYAEFLADYGETDQLIIGKMFLNYYTNQLEFALDDNMSDAYKSSVISQRELINTNYSKVYSIFKLLNKNNFSLNLTCNINHLAENKTLDIINVVGLSKSIFCLCLIPVLDVYGVLTNKLICSFDNYNPTFTSTLVPSISVDQLLQFKLTVTMSSSDMKVFITIGSDFSNEIDFPNTGRSYDVDPFFLFVPPRVATYQPGTIRLSDLRLFGTSLSDNDAMALICGFTQS